MQPRTAIPVLITLVIGFSAIAQPAPDGYDWVTVGAPGNPAYDGPDPFNLVAGRGSVGYEFRMGRTEVTTAQWLDFFNAALARPDPLPFVDLRWWGTPAVWGAIRDITYPGPGVRYRLRTDIANAGMLQVGGVSWRQAAVLCNWLENGKGTTQSAFMNGAYDVTTFTPETGSPTFNDQPAHHPGSRYWIPTLDEFMKAVHFDPDGNGPGQGRWWQQPNGTDTPLTYGPPPSFGGDGTGMANSGFTLPGQLHYQIPLGAYPHIQTPWGLLDAAGGTAEWLETIRVLDDMTRGIDGSFSGTTLTGGDLVYSWGQESPHIGAAFSGFRIASAVPAPASALVFFTVCGVLRSRRRRSHEAIAQDTSDGIRCSRAGV